MADKFAFIERIKSLKEIEKLIKNAEEKLLISENEEAREVLRRAFSHSWYMIADDNASRDTLEWQLWFALAAYERVLTIKNSNIKKRTLATKLRQKIKRVGIIETVSDAVMNGPNSQGFKILAEIGRLDASFENVVIRHPDKFDKKVVSQAILSLKKYNP